MLANYSDYTEMHGQQNIKKSLSFQKPLQYQTEIQSRSVRRF